MSFKMDFINKMADQVKGWFNQKPSSTSSSNLSVPTTSINANNVVPITRPNTSPTTTSITPSTPKNPIRNTNFHLNLNNSSHQPPLKPSNIVNNNYNYNNNNNSNHNNNNIKFNKSPNDHCPINYHHQQHTQHHHQVLPPTSLSLSNWSSASPGTPSSGGSIASSNSINIASSSSITSPFNNFTPQQQHHHHHHHQFPQHSHHQNQYHHQSHHQASSHHYTQQQTKQHSLEHSQQQLYGGSNNFNNPSSSSSSASFGPLTPSPFNNNNRNNNNDTSIGLGPRSYSAITTPDSPGNFRRQLSLNVRNQPSFRPLPLDFKSQKKSPIYAKQSASTDLIDKHSLSPRPRPKDLSLSSSQDNMLKGCFNNPMDGSSHHHPPHPPSFTNTRPDYLTMNSAQSNNVGGGSASHQPIASVYQIRLPPKFSYSLTIDGKDYKNLKESDFIKLEQLGAGNFGQVDKMLHIQSNTKLAVKKMRRSGNIDDNRHVQRDLELLLKCNYKHVVQCYGFLILETEVWIFMELMATCFDRLIQKLAEINETVPERIIGKVAVATIDALHYLKEEHNGIHRDIKPSNILINDQGIIKLCDFGISGNLINSKAHSRSKGSTPYIAPERIEPPPDGTYDIRSDIWSMGITLVEIATGRFPYENWNTDFEILSKVIQEEPPKLPEDRDFSEDFRKFINACLIKNSENRPKYKELMNYPFYKKYKVADVDVAQWFKQAYYCDTSSSRNNNNSFECNNETMDNRSNSSSASSLASNSTIK